MNKKVTALVLMAAAWVIFLPSQSNAATVEENVNLVNAAPASNTLFVQYRRGRYRRAQRLRNRSYNRYRRGNVRVVRQYYYRNGRRYVRTVRVYR